MHTTEKKKRPHVGNEETHLNPASAHPQDHHPRESVVITTVPHEHTKEGKEEVGGDKKLHEKAHEKGVDHTHHAPQHEKRAKKSDEKKYESSIEKNSAPEVSHEKKASHKPHKKRRRWNPLLLSFAAPFAAIWGMGWLKYKTMRGMWWASGKIYGVKGEKKGGDHEKKKDDHKKDHHHKKDDHGGHGH